MSGDLNQLKRSVAGTLRRAKARSISDASVPTTVGLRPPKQAGVGRIASALSRQHEICEDDRQQIDRLRKELSKIELAIGRAKRKRDELEQRMELSKIGIELERRRRAEIEKRAARYAEDLDHWLAVRKRASRAVVEVQQTMERMSTRLQEFDE